MAVSDYKIKEIPQDVSDVVPCVTDAVRIFANFEVTADEVSQLELIVTNFAGLAVKYGVGLVFDDSQVIGQSGEGCDLADAREEILSHAKRIEADTKAVQGTPVGISPALVIAIIQLGINIAKWLKERKNK